MSRTDRILSMIDRKAPGVEIGPSFRPIAPRSEGFRVDVIDHLSQADLKAKYKDHGVPIDKIEHVDHVWNGSSYADLIGRRNSFEWVIASHVIEHTPDLIGFIKSCDELLTDTGVIALAIPDKRFCFDYFRARTSLGAVIDANVHGYTNQTLGSVADFCLNACDLDGKSSWHALNDGTLKFSHDLNATKGLMDAVKNGSYVDVHRWCFTPSSFRLLVNDLNLLGLIATKECFFVDTIGEEFLIGLSQSGTGASLSRMELTQMSLAEEAAYSGDLARENAKLKEQLRQVYNSNSWRITGPLRALRGG